VKSDNQFYSVQPLAPDGGKDGGLISTDAASPQQAAEKVLGEPLSLHGKVPRAQVWTIDEAYSPRLLTLYASEVKS
jgi:hypothetical protein